MTKPGSSSALADLLVAIGEMLATSEHLQETGWQPMFDDIKTICGNIDKFCSVRTSVDWELYYSSRSAPGGSVRLFPECPRPAIVLYVPFIADLLYDCVRDAEKNGPLFVGNWVVSVETAPLMFMVWTYFHEVIHIVDGHLKYLMDHKARLGKDPDLLTRRALEFDADWNSSISSLNFLRTILLPKGKLSELEVKLLLITGQYTVMRKLSEDRAYSADPIHPTLPERIAWCVDILSQCGNTSPDGKILDLEAARKDHAAISAHLDRLEQRHLAVIGLAARQSDIQKALKDIGHPDSAIPHEITERWTTLKHELDPYRYPWTAPSRSVLT